MICKIYTMISLRLIVYYTLAIICGYSFMAQFWSVYLVKSMKWSKQTNYPGFLHRKQHSMIFVTARVIYKKKVLRLLKILCFSCFQWIKPKLANTGLVQRSLYLQPRCWAMSETWCLFKFIQQYFINSQFL